MTHFSDPEKSKIADAKKLEMDRLWRQGAIFDNTYLRSLFILGFLLDEARTELSLLKMDKLAIEEKRRRLWDRNKKD